jgi:hypothetical protein
VFEHGEVHRRRHSGTGDAMDELAGLVEEAQEDDDEGSRDEAVSFQSSHRDYERRNV